MSAPRWNGQASGRVVITGIGGTTPLGTGVDVFWPKLLAGESGVAHIEGFDASPFTTRIAAQVKDFDAEQFLDRKDARRLDRFISFAVAGGRMAFEDAKLEIDDELSEQIGVLIGSGIGGLTMLGEQHRRLIEMGPDRVSPFLVPFMIPDMASGYTSIILGLKGPNTCVVTACATGANSIGDAYHIIKRGDAVGMLAGGSEAPINEIGISAFCAARAMTRRNDDPTHASRPFELNRDGFIIGEGCGVVMLEDLDFAKSRGAHIYGEVVGYGMSGDAFHITNPAPGHAGAIRSMKAALKSAGLQPNQIGYINAHGTSTPVNDKLETEAIKSVFQDVAYTVPISSTKSMMGHTLGATGAIEAVICLLAMRDGMLPPTTNYETPDPDCDLDYIPNTARKADIEYAMSNSFGFGGHNATLILKKYTE